MKRKKRIHDSSALYETQEEVSPIKETPEIPPENFETCVFCGKTVWDKDNNKIHILENNMKIFLKNMSKMLRVLLILLLLLRQEFAHTT